MTETFPEYGIQNLVLTKKGDRSMEALSMACGGIPTRANLQRIATKEAKSFPTNDVILGLARGLHVRPIDVVLSYAVSLGLPAPAPGSDLVIADGARLPSASQEVLHAMAENMLWWQEQVEISREQDSAPEADDVAEVHELFPVDESRLAADRGQPGIDPDQLPDS